MNAISVRKRRTGIECVGGIAAMPACVTGEGEPSYLSLDVRLARKPSKKNE